MKQFLKELIPRRETYLLPRMRSRRIFFCTIAFQASTPTHVGVFRVHALCREWGTRSSRIAISGKICAFFATRAKFEKKTTIGMCACLSTVIVQSFAGRRASRAEEQCFARTLLYVFFSSRVTLFLGNAFFEFMYSSVVVHVQYAYC